MPRQSRNIRRINYYNSIKSHNSSKHPNYSQKPFPATVRNVNVSKISFKQQCNTNKKIQNLEQKRNNLVYKNIKPIKKSNHIQENIISEPNKIMEKTIQKLDYKNIKPIQISNHTQKNIISKPNKIMQKTIKKLDYDYKKISGEKLLKCSICRQIDNGIITKTKCNHIFHKDCLNIWKNISNTCPMCRNTL